MLSVAGPLTMPAKPGPFAPVGRSVPISVSSCFQPEAASTESLRSRRMSACWVTNWEMPRSMRPLFGSPFWIDQSNPSMPLLRWMPGPWTMMSSPDSPS